MTIKEIEARTGLPRASVRYYESEGLISPARGDNGYRDYSEEDCTLLLKIKLLRQLGCSLEDVKALQAGERPLDGVLEERLAQLAGDRAELDRAQALCEKLRADGAGWDDLDPARYLDWILEPPQPEVPDVRYKIPWRRYLARMLDLNLYRTLWQILLGLVFRVNILQRGTGGEILDTAASLLLMLALEPLFLHKFGTTPGKAILGLRLTRSDGSYFRYEEGLERTVQVLGLGICFLVPLVNFITLLLSYFRCRWGREQPWALEDETWSDFAAAAPDFWTAKGCGRRVLGYVGTEALCVLLILVTFFFALLPPHRGAMTPEQFAENYNYLLTFSEAPERPGRLLAADGTWYDPENSIIFDLGSPNPDLDIETENGTVSAVSYTVENALGEDGVPVISFQMVPVNYGLYIMSALTGRGTVLLPGQWSRTVQEVKQFQGEEQSWTADGWTITCTLNAEGYGVTSDGYFIAQEGLAHHFAYRFRMERAEMG